MCPVSEKNKYLLWEYCAARLPSEIQTLAYSDLLSHAFHRCRRNGKGFCKQTETLPGSDLLHQKGFLRISDRWSRSDSDTAPADISNILPAKYDHPLPDAAWIMSGNEASRHSFSRSIIL